ncbi:ganglioside GM2 activator-like [Patiria miniata]|uniref:MD-2-related lipid-recognition domain-containing protein n=1 Tax=Patiria miniata TaxID=46514 RepID=A0A914B7M6_PATMI|nr:ganglioside GM2 activator-like [Patiria miniata]
MDSFAVTAFLALLVISGSEGAYFSWQQCPSTADDAALQVRDFNISPDPVTLNDNAYMSLSSEVTRNVTYPLTLTLTIKKVTFFDWEMRIPCFSMLGGLPVGSCQYDVCSSLEYLESRYGCPSEFTDNGLPCHCPFAPAGSSYRTASTEPIRIFLDTTGLPTIMTTFLTGKYRMIADVTDANDNKVLCVEYRMNMTS